MNVRWTLLILVVVYVLTNQFGSLVPDCPERAESRTFLRALVATKYVQRRPIGKETPAEREFLTKLYQRTFHRGDRPLDAQDGVALREALGALSGLQQGWSQDFYHLWAIPVARRLSSDLRDPYVDPASYVSVLRRHAPREEDPRFVAPHAMRQDRFDPTGTPLVYTLFAFLPSGYVQAATTFSVFQVIAFLVAMLLLGRLLGLDLSTNVLLAVLSLWLWSPIQTDLNTGNVNAFQLLLLAAIIATHRLARRAMANTAGTWKTAALVALPLLLVLIFAAFKPNAYCVVPCVLASWVLSFPKRELVRACVLALPPFVTVLLLPVFWFGTFEVWFHWLHYLQVFSGDKLTDYGNYAFSKRIEILTAIPEAIVRHGLLALLLASFAALLPWRVGHGETKTLACAFRPLRDPVLSISIGVLLSLVTAPLVWQHYYVLALIPLLYVLTRFQRPTLAVGLAILAALMMARAIFPVARELGVERDLAFDLFEMPFAWVPLWIALLLAMRGPKRSPGVLENAPAVS